MKRESLITWAIVVGLLLFAGFASAILPFVLDEVDIGGSGSGLSYEPEEKPVVIMLEDYVLGDLLVQLPLLGKPVSLFGQEIGPLNGTVLSQGAAASILTGIVLITLAIVGAPLALIYVRLGRTVENTLEDEAFQASQADLNQKAQARAKALQEAKPATIGQPPERRRRWSTYLLGVMILVIVWVSAVALGKAIYGNSIQVSGDRLVDPSGTFTLVVVGLTALVLILLAATGNLGRFDETAGEDRAVNWGAVWVLLSGLLIVGLGLGLTVAIRSG